jgi:hypothetical protein
MRPGRWSRVVRGAAVAGFATFVAALAHTIGGGQAPGILAVAVSLAFSGLLAIAVAGARASAGRVTVTVAAAQLALHVLYSLSTPVADVAESGGAQPAHAHGIATVLPVVAGTGHAPLHYPPLMVLTHAVAVAVTVIAILRGRAALAAVGKAARLAGRTLGAALGLLLPVPPVRSAASAALLSFERRPVVLGVVFAALRYRGPPVVVAVR